MEITRQQSHTIRGIAIFLLLLHHYSGMDYAMETFWIFRWVGTIVCAVFFFFSGYGMSLSIEKAKKRGFKLKRLLTLYIPFLLANILFLLYHEFIKNETFGTLDSILYISGIKLINGHTWFLQVLIILYLCCFVVAERNKQLIICLLGGIYIALTGKIYALSFLTFIIGLYWKEISKYVSSSANKIILMFAIGSFAIYAYNGGRMNTIPLLTNFVTMNAFIAIVVLRLTMHSSVLAWIGKNSMAFYITHGLPLRFVADFDLEKTIATLLIYLCLAGIIGLVFLWISKPIINLCNARIISKSFSLDKLRPKSPTD